MSRTLGKEAEDRLLHCIKQAQGHISEGMDPTEAITKIARERQISADMIPLMVQAYNVGRQGFQRETNDDILAKLGEFPIARREDVLRTIFPEKVEAPCDEINKTAVAADYSQPPPLRKSAESVLREKSASTPLKAEEPTPAPLMPETQWAKKAARRQYLDHELDKARAERAFAWDRYLEAMGKVAGYFRRSDREPAGEVGYNATRMFGSAAESCVKYAARQARVKVAEFKPGKLARPVSKDAEPYCLIQNAIKCGQEYLRVKQDCDARIEKAAQEREALLRPFGAPETQQRLKSPLLGEPSSMDPSKVAGFLDGMMGGMAMGIGRGFTAETQPKTTPELVSGVEGQLSDPAHQQELQQIEAQAILQDMVNNDDVISGFDEDEVASAYNEILQLNPSAAVQPAVLRPLLRKRLTAGGLEAFDAQQAADLETSLRKNEALPRVGDAFRGSELLG